jgi:hypothetical protein
MSRIHNAWGMINFKENFQIFTLRAGELHLDQGWYAEDDAMKIVYPATGS